ncbi:Cupin domain-containing protein [Chitinophaga terrae (ex Kim and Jung 2007)]|uniref:Cupin domain-containing protein n=1 Tax=Chitinophaga terrae (ex Kim and Jung 2007) TaxID=408074 RepID=A0A1H4FSX4_9BACT|nr:cupin domain-containing protein [Chitinophaga terrae (ex Kim and Jung 2007)]MDQ0105392.1 quercetin dioxygenase-like cupin family protein [Chitinophaga terrae (ex Kim and Jung 2007)]GEP92844.1 hypothetical protein CTE07_44890 [Chitinophaga terrae (ex Kim and Jung 2007)]SEB00384.1 Cupin domain-containing protein [Chitinophaga terrae (ex Kim and Jung 2007)]
MKSINVLLAEGNEKIKSCALFKTKRFDATLLIIQQGHQVPPHTSSTHALILVLEGKTAFMLNDEITVLEAGDVFTFKANEVHALQALETTRLLLVK